MRLQVHRLVATAMDPLVPTKEPKEPITVTPNQIIYHRRVRVMEHARRTSVSEACRTFGVSRTTFYRWQRRVEAMLGGDPARRRSSGRGYRSSAFPEHDGTVRAASFRHADVATPQRRARRGRCGIN